ncbi:LuxR family transcriptional regulator [Adlercreutzia sp. R21]|uniref:helix-turn-helix transcriptional regulator n=1 Tax=Adlercreutzia wanghongyangiae TaxID=3111451 RepID=UPI002DBCB29D|nr:LuxR family transcriptional regulator [Adlercreutzia sp. R21]MEC4184873.1 LuxR family transcriptional regulator [Adlercreutzia sp. R21]
MLAFVSIICVGMDIVPDPSLMDAASARYEALLGSYTQSGVVFALAWAVVALLPRWAARCTEGRAVWVAAVLLAAVMGFSMAVNVGQLSAGSPWVVLAADALSGMCAGLLALAVGLELCKLESRAIVTIVGAGVPVAMFVYCFMIAFPVPLFVAATVAIPLVAAAALVACRQEGRKRPGRVGGAGCEEPARGESAPSSAEGLSQRAVVGVVLGMVAVGLVCEGAQSLQGFGTGDLPGSNGFLLLKEFGALGTALAAALLLAPFIWLTQRRKGAAFYGVLFTLLFVDAVGLLVPALFGPSAAGQVVFGIAGTATWGCSAILLWLTAILLACSPMRANVRMFATVRLASCLGQILGQLAAGALGNAGELPVEVAVECAMGAVLILVATILFLLPERNFELLLRSRTERGPRIAVSANGRLEDVAASPAAVAEAEPASQREDDFRQTCQDLAQRCGLSEREVQVMMLLAQGRNSAYIQKQLFVSASTVSSHRQHVYQKLDIHSQQELIDLVEASRVQDR